MIANRPGISRALSIDIHQRGVPSRLLPCGIPLRRHGGQRPLILPSRNLLPPHQSKDVGILTDFEEGRHNTRPSKFDKSSQM
jgi:hypothetical protein